MKKLLIFSALAVAGIMTFRALNKGTDSANTIDPQVSQIDQILRENEGRLVSDKDGYWFLIKGGKLLLSQDDPTFFAWAANHPDMVNGNPLPISVWVPFNETLYGGTFTATT